MLKFKSYLPVIAVLLASSVAGDEPPTDHAINDSLKRAFQHEYRLREAGLEVSTFNGSVTLKGTVET